MLRDETLSAVVLASSTKGAKEVRHAQRTSESRDDVCDGEIHALRGVFLQQSPVSGVVEESVCRLSVILG